MLDPMQINIFRKRRVQRSRTRGVLALLLGLMFCSSAIADDGAAAVSKAYQIKAAFLYNFAKFVEWPAQSFADANSPIIIGTYCPDAFAATLEQVVKDRKVNGRTLVVRKLES